MLDIFLTSMSWFTQSKAFLKSMKTAEVILNLCKLTCYTNNIFSLSSHMIFFVKSREKMQHLVGKKKYHFCSPRNVFILFYAKYLICLVVLLEM